MLSPPLLLARAQCEGSSDAAAYPDDQRALKLLFSGGLAGAVSRTATAPLDRLKFLMQVSSTSRMTLSQGLARMASEKSVAAYFRGNGANVLKNVPETALKLTLNDRIKGLVLRDGHQISIRERLLIGGLSGAVAQTLIYPLEVIQTRLAATHQQYTGIWNAAQQIRAAEGRLAFFRGWTAAIVGILPYAGVDIALFELLKEQILEHHEVPPPHLLLGAGMLSSSVAQTVAYPLGFVRTRLQMDGMKGQPRVYSGLLDCLAKVLRQEGFPGLYKGFSMSLLKIAPAAGISWWLFEEVKLFLHVGDIVRHH